MTKQGKFLTILLLIIVVVAGGAIWRYTQTDSDGPPSLEESQDLLQGKIKIEDRYYYFDTTEDFNYKNFVELKEGMDNYVYFKDDKEVKEIFNSIQKVKGEGANISYYNNGCVEGEKDGFVYHKSLSDKLIKNHCLVIIEVTKDTAIGEAMAYNDSITEAKFHELLERAPTGWSLIPTTNLRQKTDFDRITSDIDADFEIHTLQEDFETFEKSNITKDDISIAWVNKEASATKKETVVSATDTISIDLTKGNIVNDGENIASVKSKVFTSQESSYMEVPGQLVESDAITLMASINPADYSGSILEYGDFEIYIDRNNGVSFKFGIDGKKFVTNYDKAIAPNEWYLVVGVYSNGVAKLYLDGELIGTRQREGVLNPFGEASSVIVGKDFEGGIANVRIYNKEITAEQIQDLM